MAKRKRMVDTSQPEHEVEVGPSRSERRAVRKDAQARLEAVGLALTRLTPAALAGLQLGEELGDEVRRLAELGPGSALARQRRRVAGLLRHLDLDALEREVAEAGGATAQRADTSHRLERARRELIDGGDAALAELLDAHPSLDRQRLRQAVRAAQREVARDEPGKRYRELFQLLKELGVGER